jgi:translation initiation factor 1
MAKKNQNNGEGLVFSTEFGKMCPGCSKPVASCLCQKKGSLAQGDGIVRLMRETKGRKGKGVTRITGLVLENDRLKKMAKTLKQKCGTGGSIKDGVIEIQGDHRDVLEKELGLLGYKVKRCGG